MSCYPTPRIPGGRPGNKNSAKGPRVGRKDKQPTKKVAPPALPTPAPSVKANATTARSSRAGPITSRAGT